MQNIEATHPFVTSDNIGGRIAFWMPDVQTCSARVWEHVEDVELRLRLVEIFVAGIWCMKTLPLFPDRLPFWFDLMEWVRFAALTTHVETIS